ncbi:cytochrome c oxidase subunit II [Parashewanella curva]|uniref:Cytochrome c oxidase subunit 2 n=1 Tax=Parashewanella curva TaxID=2338552 RepID=A0A3L8PXC2_9GAMM|nr:cytochrome c oxidase subunit II [Parashewanella curva]
MTKGVTGISHDIYHLHMTIFYICCAIGVGVFGAMIYAMLRHRKSQGHKAANFHESVKVELAWTIIPFLILIAMAVPATGTLIKMDDTKDAALTIKITASQWKWHYDYFNKGVGFYSILKTPQKQIDNQQAKDTDYLLEVDKPLVLPVNRKIRFLITSEDVIHSWFIPAFAIQKDANPGFINEAWTRIDKTGVYRGQCAQLCGKGHGFMPIVVKAVSGKEFDSWLKAQQQAKLVAAKSAQAALSKTLSKADLMKEGQNVYLAHCAVCHQPNGMGLQGVFPALKGSKTATGPVHDHIHTVKFGRLGTAMQAFSKQLTDEEIAAAITYERNSWGNNMGDAVQASDVHKVKQ